MENKVELTPEQWHYARERFCEKMREWAKAYITSVPDESVYTRKERNDFGRAWELV